MRKSAIVIQPGVLYTKVQVLHSPGSRAWRAQSPNALPYLPCVVRTSGNSRSYGEIALRAGLQAGNDEVSTAQFCGCFKFQIQPRRQPCISAEADDLEYYRETLNPLLVNLDKVSHSIHVNFVVSRFFPENVISAIRSTLTRGRNLQFSPAPHPGVRRRLRDLYRAGELHAGDRLLMLETEDAYFSLTIARVESDGALTEEHYSEVPCSPFDSSLLDFIEGFFSDRRSGEAEASCQWFRTYERLRRFASKRSPFLRAHVVEHGDWQIRGCDSSALERAFGTYNRRLGDAIERTLQEMNHPPLTHVFLWGETAPFIVDRTLPGNKPGRGADIRRLDNRDIAIAH